MAFGLLAALTLTATSAAVQSETQSRQFKRVEKKEDKLRAVETAIQGEQAARQRRGQVAKARVAQAEIENVAAGGSQTQSSAVISSTGSVGSQAASNIGQINTSVSQSNALTKAKERVTRAGRGSTIFESILSGAAGVAGQIGAAGAAKSIFGP